MLLIVILYTTLTAIYFDSLGVPPKGIYHGETQLAIFSQNYSGRGGRSGELFHMLTCFTLVSSWINMMRQISKRPAFLSEE